MAQYPISYKSIRILGAKTSRKKGGDSVGLLLRRCLGSQYVLKSLQYILIGADCTDMRIIIGRIEGVGEQFMHRPGMIGQPGGHGRGAGVVARWVLLHLLPQ